MNLFLNFLLVIFVACSLMTTRLIFADDAMSDVGDEFCKVAGAADRKSGMYAPGPDTEEIMELERKACRMIAAGHIREMVDEIIHEDGLLFLDGGDILYGREQQFAMFNEFIKEIGVYLTYEPTEAHVSDSRDMAWAFGIYKFKIPDSDMEVGKYLSVWQKHNGQWKNVAEMRNPF